MTVAQHDLTELAKLGYRAYGETTDFKNYQGNPMPEWEDLGEKIRSAWVAATAAICKKLLNGAS